MPILAKHWELVYFQSPSCLIYIIEIVQRELMCYFNIEIKMMCVFITTI